MLVLYINLVIKIYISVEENIAFLKGYSTRATLKLFCDYASYLRSASENELLGSLLPQRRR